MAVEAALDDVTDLLSSPSLAVLLLAGSGQGGRVRSGSRLDPAPG